MEKITREFLEERIFALQKIEGANGISVYEDFGRDCAKTYIPALLAEIDALKAPTFPASPEIDFKNCDSCYWQHQSIKYGCAECQKKSEYIFMFNPDAAKRHAEILAKQGGLK